MKIENGEWRIENGEWRLEANSQFTILNSQFSFLKPTFAAQLAALRQAFDSLAGRHVILFGGKGGVGKTTLASLAAVHFAESRRVTLFSTDPASNLADLFGRRAPSSLRIEALDAATLYEEFLEANLPAFLELGDRGTYLDREELKRFFELAIPGIDELMAWMRIGELAERSEELLIVDTAPTGHTLRMLSSSEHFRQLEKALASMQAKHRDLVEQLTRRSVRDGMDEFLDSFGNQLASYRTLATDPERSAFVPVFLSEPWIVEQTRRLVTELHSLQITVPFAVLNQTPHDASPSPAFGFEVVTAPRGCVQLDSVPRLRSYLMGHDERHEAGSSRTPASSLLDLRRRQLIFFAGKGGVGKTTTASSVALQYAARSPRTQFTLISVDPAHSVRDVFAGQTPPPNLSVELIDTKAKWNHLREGLGDKIARAIGALTPQGVSLVHDGDVMQQLLEIAPPGADELFAIMRLADLARDQTRQQIFVDTAPTGHFLRLLELPKSAGEWVREFMRLLLKYKDLIPPGSLGEQLVHASRALSSFDELLRSERCATVVVTRPDRIVAEETRRLMAALRGRGMLIAGTVANYLGPDGGCGCDQSRRSEETEILNGLEGPLVMVERRTPPPTRLEDLRSLIPLRQDGSP